jgi:3-oxoacyl-[acyl-carrier protein] reductase
MNSFCSLEGKKALVTGASGGIGGAIARALHSRGAMVTLSGTKSDKLKSLANELADNVYYVACDLRVEGSSAQLIETSYNIMEGLDILVCNAGVTKDGLLLRMKEETFMDVINVNLYSSFTLNKEAIRLMLKKRWGRIINISSIVGFTGNAGQVNYAASKAGIVGMSKSISLEVASRNITVNCIAPGFIDTAMTEALTDEQRKKLAENIPMGRTGSVQEVANSVVFLASNEASYITGQTIHVNGGLLMA